MVGIPLEPCSHTCDLPHLMYQRNTMRKPCECGKIMGKPWDNGDLSLWLTATKLWRITTFARKTRKWQFSTAILDYQRVDSIQRFLHRFAQAWKTKKWSIWPSFIPKSHTHTHPHLQRESMEPLYPRRKNISGGAKGAEARVSDVALWRSRGRVALRRCDAATLWGTGCAATLRRCDAARG